MKLIPSLSKKSVAKICFTGCLGWFVGVSAASAVTFTDTFSGDLSNWVLQPSDVGSDWHIQNGYLSAFYTTDAGGTGNTQSDFLLANPLQPAGDFRASVDFTFTRNRQYANLANALAVFSIFGDAGHKMQMGAGLNGWGYNGGPANQAGVFVQAYDNGWTSNHSFGSYVPLAWDANAWNTAGLERVGSHYRMFLNNTLLAEYEDTFLNGSGRLGLHAYGEYRYDNFFVTTDIPSNPVPDSAGSLGLMALSLAGLVGFHRLGGCRVGVTGTAAVFGRDGTHT